MKSYMYNIGFLRFLFAMMIVYYHLVQFLNSYFNTHFYQRLVERSGVTGGAIVFAFFVMSGFFLYSYENKKDNFKKFFFKKIIRLWPVMFFSFVTIVFMGHINPIVDFLNCIFISSGIGVIKADSTNAATWFICVLFWLSLLFYYVINELSRNALTFLCAILTFFSFAALSHAESGYYSAIAFPPLILTSGMLRGIGGMSIGILLGIFVKKNIDKNLIKNKFVVIFCTIAEILFMYIFIMLNSYKVCVFPDDIFYVMLFVIIFILFIYNIGIFSRFLNIQLFRVLGNASFSIYVMHFPVIYFMRDYIWPNYSGGFFLITVGCSLCALVGLLTYALIERPAYAWLMQKCNHQGE